MHTKYFNMEENTTTVIKTSIGNLSEDKKGMYRLTRQPGLNVKDFEDGQKAHVEAFCLYTDVNSKGTEQTVLTLITDVGKLQTISPTFIQSFLDVQDLMGDDYSIIIRKAKSKGGREFVTCELDCD